MSFDNLKKLGRCVDNKIRKLNKIWETPHNIINNTNAVDKEVQVQVENFLTTINKLHVCTFFYFFYITI